MKKSIYSVGRKQKKSYKNNIEKHSQKIKIPSYVFYCLKNICRTRKRKMDFASESIFLI